MPMTLTAPEMLARLVGFPTVVGLPLAETAALLQAAGYPLWRQT